MTKTRLLTEALEADRRLSQFGVSRLELLQIVQAVVAGRAEAVPGDDPASAEGYFAYVYGTRFIRRIFRAHGWLPHREDNVEFVRHPDTQLKIAYQSVDLACSSAHIPQAVSGKGAGSDRLIASGQGELFTENQEQAAQEAMRLAKLQAGVWFFCVSVDGDDVRAELSLPTRLDGRNFEGFIERIFIVREGDWRKVMSSDAPEGDATDFEPIISRR